MGKSLIPAVKALADRAYALQKSEQTIVDIEQGYLKDARLPDPSFENFKEKRAIALSLCEEIDTLKKMDISNTDNIMLDALKYICENDYLAVDDPDAEEYYWLRFQVTPYSCFFPKLHQVLANFQIKNNDDTRDYLKLLEQYPRYVRAVRKRFMGQAKRGIRLPLEEIPLVVSMLTRLCFNQESHPLCLTMARLSRLKGDTNPYQERACEAAALVNKEIEKIINFIDEDYKSLSSEKVGLSQYPAGESFYRLHVKQRTTTDITPEEIHDIGLDEVEKVENRMKEIRESLGYECSLKEFQKIIDTDKRFLPKDADDVGVLLNRYLDRIRPVMDDWFSSKPKADCEAQRLDPGREAGITFGYYMEPTASNPKGIFYYNGANEAKKSQIGAASLIYHELLPGHHFQVSMVFEDDSLHKVRKNLFITAYLEGWAEYAADLAGEMGMYDDPYDEYGRLMMVLFASIRLVVDTGMNLMGWSRLKAAEYLKERTNLTDEMIFTETLRYACDLPAQALAYRLSSLQFMEMKQKAKKAMGDKFDIREFHDIVLKHGVLPLNVVEKNVDRYIQSIK